MDGYISRQTAEAEILAAYADGRIATAEDIISVLDLVPAADVTPERMAELAQAARDGRLVVLPPDGSDDSALCALYQGEGIIFHGAGDPECALALLSYQVCCVAEMMGTTYRDLLTEMAHRPSIMERAKAAEAAIKDTDHGHGEEAQ